MGCTSRTNRAWGKQHWHGQHWHGSWDRSASSGNTAFDEYRDETVRRLEDEQNEFTSFLDNLRKAKDQAEFDQFMSDRARRTDRPVENNETPSVPPTA